MKEFFKDRRWDSNTPPKLPDGRVDLSPRASMQWALIGGLLSAISESLGVDPAAALAVWLVETGDLPFVEGKPVLRLESHKLWEHWGRHNPVGFDQHFRFGGRGNTPGAAWSNQQFRPASEDIWQSYHGKQESEYAAFELAVKLAGFEAACLSSSFGGPQILGSNHAALGYASATELFHAFAMNLDAQVIGFFDFCHSMNALNALRTNDWVGFARIYNGPGQASTYADHINDAWLESVSFLTGTPLHPSLIAKRAFNGNGFRDFFAALDLKHFSAREFLFRGVAHAQHGHAAYGLNSFPPKDVWQNIGKVAKALDTFRAQAGAPFILTSIYRSAAYNDAIGGSPNSQHMHFSAVDFEVRSTTPVEHWLTLLRDMRRDGLFSGAVGSHGIAIHIDARGIDIDF